ncbi:CinA family protein [Porcincola intestinalis]|nr:CinA family protein [Porcincola intestinalis]MCI6698885.1 CinA family protein [Lachnospiraceae bacterium]
MESSQGTSEIRRQQTVECRDRQRGMQDGSNGERHAGMSDDALGGLLNILRQRGETVTTVESLTAGLISARIADIPGASDVMKRAYVTYCDEAKHEMVGVSRQTLETYTAVSAQTAQEMAIGGARQAHAALCLAATGYAGPPSGPDDHSVGLVYLGCCYRGQVTVEEHHYQGSRNEVREAAREDALCLMAKALAW